MLLDAEGRHYSLSMKKSMFLFIIMIALILTGCSKKEQMTNFIPTQAPTAEDTDTDTEDSGQTAEPETPSVTPTPKPIVVGNTIPMYVKLDEFGGTLNVRETPSTSGTKVGFLVNAEKVDVIEIKDGWASFIYNGAICYVSADYLVEEQPEFLEKPSPAPKPKNTPAPEEEVSDDI